MLNSKYGLHPLHPAMVDLHSLTERVAELEKALGRPFVVERGPWEASEDGRGIASEDFTHDVVLRITGDFTDDAQRQGYAQEIARRLNAEGAHAPGWLPNNTAPPDFQTWFDAHYSDINCDSPRMAAQDVWAAAIASKREHETPLARLVATIYAGRHWRHLTPQECELVGRLELSGHLTLRGPEEGRVGRCTVRDVERESRSAGRVPAGVVG